MTDDLIHDRKQGWNEDLASTSNVHTTDLPIPVISPLKGAITDMGKLFKSWFYGGHFKIIVLSFF